MTPTALAAALRALLIAALGTWVLARFAPHPALLDVPNERSSHVRPTPRGGGLALVAAITTGCLRT